MTPQGLDSAPLLALDLDRTLLTVDSFRLWCRSRIRPGLLRPGAYPALLTLVRATLLSPGDVLARREHLLNVIGFPFHTRRGREELAQFVDHLALRCCDSSLLDVVVRRRQEGLPTVLVTASPDFYVEPLTAALGLSAYACTRTTIEDDRLRFTTALCIGSVKLACLQELAAGLRVPAKDIAAITDHHNDLPMLEWVGYPYVVRPTQRLRTHARARGWPCLD